MNNVVVFIGGAACGALVSFFCLKGYFKQQADEEVADVVEKFNNRLKKVMPEEKDKNDIPSEKKESDTPSYNVDVLAKYGTMTKKYGDPRDKIVVEAEKEHPSDDSNDIYTITPDEFASLGKNDKVNCTYYSASDTLVNEYGIEIDIDETITRRSLDEVGVYEENVVYVRNNHLGYDYAVSVDTETEII